MPSKHAKPSGERRTAVSTVVIRFSMACFLCCSGLNNITTGQEEKETSIDKVIQTGAERLIDLQLEDGSWPYEGVYRVSGEIPVGYRIGGTAICATALLYSNSDDDKAQAAILRGVKLIRAELKNPLMKPSRENRYDVRIWGHIYALDLFCRLVADPRFAEVNKELEQSIKSLAAAVMRQELDNGGWNYANRQSHASFVTAPAVQSLLWARQSGIEVPEEFFQRAMDRLQASRSETGAFAYSGQNRDSRPAKLPGSIARSANCEVTLALLGLERQPQIRRSIAAFHEHWEELEKRRKQPGTHVPPYGVAPYYFYYGHRFIAPAIQMLPETEQAAALQKFVKVLLRTRDSDGTWNDRVFDQSKAYGTAMSMLALLGERVPLPQGLKAANDSTEH